MCFLVSAGLGDEPFRVEDPFGGEPAVDRVEKLRDLEPTQLDPSYESRVHQRIAGELAASTSMSFIDMPLAEVLRQISKSHQIPIVLDADALTNSNIDPNTSVSIDVRNVNFRSALKLMLSNLELTHVTKDETLQITTKSSVMQTPYEIVYLLGSDDVSNRVLVERLQTSLNQKRTDAMPPHKLTLLKPSDASEKQMRLLVRANRLMQRDVHGAVRQLHEASKTDLEKIQGVWEIVRGETNGVSMMHALKKRGRFHITFAGNRMKMTAVDGRESVFEFTLNPKKSPKTIDLVPKISANQQGIEQVRVGIYGVKGDDAVLCLANDDSVGRPDKFAAPEGSRFSFVLLNRASR